MPYPKRRPPYLATVASLAVQRALDVAHSYTQTANGLLNTERVPLLQPTIAGGPTKSTYSPSQIGQKSFAAAGLETFDPAFAALLTLDARPAPHPATGAGPSSSGGGGASAASASAGQGPTHVAFANPTPGPGAAANPTAAQDALFAAASTPTPLPLAALRPPAPSPTTTATAESTLRRGSTRPPPSKTWSPTPPPKGIHPLTPLTSPPEDGDKEKQR